MAKKTVGYWIWLKKQPWYKPYGKAKGKTSTKRYCKPYTNRNAGKKSIRIPYSDATLYKDGIILKAPAKKMLKPKICPKTKAHACNCSKKRVTTRRPARKKPVPVEQKINEVVAEQLLGEEGVVALDAAPSAPSSATSNLKLYRMLSKDQKEGLRMDFSLDTEYNPDVDIPQYVEYLASKGYNAKYLLGRKV